MVEKYRGRFPLHPGVCLTNDLNLSHLHGHETFVMSRSTLQCHLDWHKTIQCT